MNDQNTQTNNQPAPEQQSQPQQQPIHHAHNIYWALVLILMGCALAAAALLVFKNRFIASSTIAPQPPVMTRETSQSTATDEIDVIQQDNRKDTSTVSNEIMTEIDDIGKSDVDTTLSNDKLNDLE